MRNRWFWAIMAVLCLAQGLGAQQKKGTAKPFYHYAHPVSLQDYANFLAGNDDRYLNADCKKILDAGQSVLGRTFDSCIAGAAYMRQLEVRPCPPGEARLARIFASGKIDMSGQFTRKLRTDRKPNPEQCVYSDNQIIAELDSGNWFLGWVNAPPPVTTMASAPPPQAPVETVVRRETYFPRDTTVVQVTVNPVIDDHHGLSWWVKGPILGASAAGVTCLVVHFVSDEDCFKVKNISINRNGNTVR